MRLRNVYSKLVQVAHLPLARWPAFLRGVMRRKASGRIPCVLPGARQPIQVPTQDFEQSYRFFAEAPHGRSELGYFIGKMRSGDILFDIGAFRGVYGAGAIAALGDEVTVHFFEPLATNSQRLQALIDFNQFSQTVIIEKAVGNGAAVTGTIGDDMMLQSSRTHDSPAFSSTSLDAYIQQTGIIPTILKIDVEGFEGEVIAGAQRLLRENKPRIWLELHPARLTAKGLHWEGVVDSLQRLGYAVSTFSDFEFPGREFGFHVWCEVEAAS